MKFKGTRYTNKQIPSASPAQSTGRGVTRLPTAALAAVWAGALLSTAPTIIPAQSLYAEMIIADVVDRNVECAATIMALGEQSHLASTVSGYFLGVAVSTLTGLGGWEDSEAASRSIISQAVFMTEDIALALHGGKAEQGYIDTQEDCILGVLHD